MLSQDDFERIVYVYKLVMSCSGILSILSFSLAIYLIVYRSTSEMAQYRWYLINIVGWSLLYDIYQSILYLPSFEFPKGACIYGLLGNFKIFDKWAFKQFLPVILFTLLNGVCTSIVSAFFYRLAAVTKSVSTLHNKRSLTIMILAHILYSMPLWIYSFYSIDYDYAKVLSDVNQRYPNVYKLNLNYSCIYTSDIVNPGLVRIYRSVSVMFVLNIVVVVSVLIFIIMRKISKQMAMMTGDISTNKRLLDMHRQFTLSLIAQFFIPFITLVIPPIVMANLANSANLDDAWVRKIGSAMLVIISFHSTLNCLTMVVMIKPYRQAVINKFWSNNSTEVTVFESRT